MRRAATAVTARTALRGRTGALLVLAGLLCGCAPATHDNARLEAAVERFERAAARAEAAAAAAEASAQQAAAAAARVEPAVPSRPAYYRVRGTPQFQTCSAAGRGPVRNVAQAAAIAQRFLHCLKFSWGKVVHTVYVPHDAAEWRAYRVEYANPDPGDGERTVIVRAQNGQAEFLSLK
ncbi:MAG: hypothetical protein ABI629_25640 [bacterium]